MDIFWEELTSGLHGARRLAHVLVRLAALSFAKRYENRDGGRDAAADGDD